MEPLEDAIKCKQNNSVHTKVTNFESGSSTQSYIKLAEGTRQNKYQIPSLEL